jgi:hypothetical protein
LPARKTRERPSNPVDPSTCIACRSNSQHAMLAKHLFMSKKKLDIECRTLNDSLLHLNDELRSSRLGIYRFLLLQDQAAASLKSSQRFFLTLFSVAGPLFR